MQIEKVIGIKTRGGIDLIKLCASLDGSLNMNFYKTTSLDSNMRSQNAEQGYIAHNVLEQFKDFSLEYKKSRLFEEADNYEGQDKIDYLSDKLDFHLAELSKEVDLPFNNISIDSENLDSIDMKSLNVIRGLVHFQDVTLPAKTVGFVKKYVEKVEDVDITEAQLKNLYTKYSEPVCEAKKYYMYIGDSEKYKYCIGEHMETRDADGIELKIRFSQNNEIELDKKFWCKKENLVEFYL